jgi:ubiquinone/menaquinone biosynthesis C-methylase UbiE
MSKPVNDLAFWKERIDTAAKDQFTVYVTSEGDWKKIWENHKSIIEKEVDGTVLDLGCGYGRLSELFPSNYQGVDFSPDFIRMAKERYPKRATDFHVANLKELPFEDKSVDWGVTVSIKRMIIDNLGEEEWNEMLKEISRVCKHLLVLEYEDSDFYEIYHFEYDQEPWQRLKLTI